MGYGNLKHVSWLLPTFEQWALVSSEFFISSISLIAAT